MPAPLPHDSGYRHLFSHALLVEHLLRGFIQEDWVHAVDFSTLEPASSQAVSDQLDERRHDLVWRVRLRQSQVPDAPARWLYLFLLLEFQSRNDPWMALRMHTYVGLLYQNLVRAGLLDARIGLPPVFPLVIHHGRQRWRAAQDLLAITQAPDVLATYRPQLRYAVLDTSAADPQTRPANVAAALIALEQVADISALRPQVQHLLQILHAPQHDNLRRAFAVYLNRVLLQRLVRDENIPELNDLQEIDAMLADRVTEWTETWKREGLARGIEQGLEQGLERGRKQGEAQGLAQALVSLLQTRVGPLPPWAEQRIAQADTPTLHAWLPAVLSAQCVEDVLGAAPNVT